MFFTRGEHPLCWDSVTEMETKLQNTQQFVFLTAAVRTQYVLQLKIIKNKIERLFIWNFESFSSACFLSLSFKDKSFHLASTFSFSGNISRRSALLTEMSLVDLRYNPKAAKCKLPATNRSYKHHWQPCTGCKYKAQKHIQPLG